MYEDNADSLTYFRFVCFAFSALPHCNFHCWHRYWDLDYDGEKNTKSTFYIG